MTQLPADAIAALERGNIVDAIKIVRDRTGLDLKSSKEAVERYANGEGGQPADSGASADWQEGDWGRNEPGEAAGLQAGGVPVVPAAALAALAKGQKLEAIRLTREATGLGLAQAKDLVENHQNPPGAVDFGQAPSPQSFQANPMAEPGRVQGGGLKWLPVVIVVLLAALAWLYFRGGA